MGIITEIFKQSLTITSFVLVMMLLLDLFNVLSQGISTRILQKSSWIQIVMAAIFGAIPGCLGVYAIVALYSHKLIGFGAMLTAMIASTGDEAFLMFSVMPEKAFLIMLFLIVLSLVAGFITHAIVGKTHAFHGSSDHLEIHPGHDREILSLSHVKSFFSSFDLKKTVLLISLVFISVLIATELGHGHYHHAHHAHDCSLHGTILDHHHPMWIAVAFFIASLSAFGLVLFFSSHFVNEHVWDHIIKKHFLKIFLWIFGSIAILYYVSEAMDIEAWMEANAVLLFIVAILVGLLPVSGPHMVFVSFYAMGALPLSVLLVNSVVQDGHGALPLLAENKKSFFLMKGIKILLASVIVAAGLIIHF